MLKGHCATRASGQLGDVYMQAIEGSVLQALNSRTMEILSDWKPRHS